MRRYEIIDHTADLGIRAYGKTLPELFENVALGMLETIADLDSIDEKREIEINAQGNTLEDLLVAFLGELLFQHEVEEILFKRVEILQFNKDNLSAVAYGEEKNPQKQVIYTAIKNVTYHQLTVEQSADGTWETLVIFDL
ncbi:archease [Candidatus Poribacteria bacterium]|nr:archease [Candidatus Poribacteria bacterium]